MGIAKAAIFFLTRSLSDLIISSSSATTPSFKIKKAITPEAMVYPGTFRKCLVYKLKYQLTFSVNLMWITNNSCFCYSRLMVLHKLIHNISINLLITNRYLHVHTSPCSPTHTHTHHGTLQLCRSNAVSLAVQHIIHPPSDTVVILLIPQCTISSEIVPCKSIRNFRPCLRLRLIIQNHCF